MSDSTVLAWLAALFSAIWDWLHEPHWGLFAIIMALVVLGIASTARRIENQLEQTTSLLERIADNTDRPRHRDI